MEEDQNPAIDPAYTQGGPVKVGFANNQAEAEFLQSLLRAEGIPSFLRRTGGFDVPDYVAAGPRDIMVASSAQKRAREILSPESD